MAEGLFENLKTGNNKKKNTYGIQETQDDSLGYTSNANELSSGWDGSIVPLNNSSLDAFPDASQQKYGLPKSHAKAPWDVEPEGVEPIINENRNQNYFPNNLPQQNQQMGANWSPQNVVNVPQNVSHVPMKSNNNFNEEIPASSYSYAETPNFHSNMTNNIGQINTSPYSYMKQQLEQNQQSQMQQTPPNYSTNPYGQVGNQPYNGIPNNPNIMQGQNINTGNVNPYGATNYGYGATGIELEKPQEHVIIDEVANKQYMAQGRNNVAPNSSQYGLCDMSTTEWVKQNLLLAIPIFNLIYILYIGYFKTFVQFPTLKSWARGAMINVILTNITWIVTFYALTLLL